MLFNFVVGPSDITFGFCCVTTIYVHFVYICIYLDGRVFLSF